MISWLDLTGDHVICIRSRSRSLYFLQTQAKILVKMEDSNECSTIFGWRDYWVGLNWVLEGTPDTRPAPIGFWRRSHAVDRHKCQFRRWQVWFQVSRVSGSGDWIYCTPQIQWIGSRFSHLCHLGPCLRLPLDKSSKIVSKVK